LNDVQLKGFSELDEKLQKLPILLQEDILKKAMVAGAKIYQDYARAKAPVGTVPHKNRKGQVEQPGTGKTSIAIRKVKQDENATVRYVVGIFKKGWYMKFIESGWTPTGPKKKGTTYAKHRKEAAKTRTPVPARPFLEPAFKNVTHTVLDTVKRTIGIWLVKYGTPRKKR